MRSSALLIVNPVSGRARAGKAVDRLESLIRARGLRLDCYETQSSGDATRHVAAHGSEYDVLISVGGDGTLNEILNGMVESDCPTPVAVMPTGTANVVAEALSLPKRPEQVAELVAVSAVRKIDMGRAGERLFAMCAGIGFDAKVVSEVTKNRTERGITMFDYYLPALRAMLSYTFPTMRVEVDGRMVSDDATFTVVGNMQQYGGGFRFFNHARPDDGWLDVCCLHGTNPGDLIRYGWGAFWRELPKYKDVKVFRGREIRVDADEPVQVQVDGDLAGELPMSFHIVPASVGICTPVAEAVGEER